MARTLIGAALRGALAVPFLALPVTLTIDAPDVYGGFGVHLQAAGQLAVLGALLGLAHGARASLAAWLDSPRGRLLLRALAVVVATWAVAVGVFGSATGGADLLAGALGRLPEGTGMGDPYGPGRTARALAIALFVALAAGVRREAGVRRAVVLILASALVLGANRFAAFFVRVPRGVPSDVPPWMGQFADVPGLALLGLALVLVPWAWRSPPSARVAAALDELAADPVDATERALLGILLLPASLGALRVGALVAEALQSAVGASPEPTATPFGAAATVAFVGAIILGALRARTGAHAQQWLRAAASVWGLLVVGRAATSIAGAPSALGELAPLGIAIAWMVRPSVWEGRWGSRLVAIGPSLVGLLMGPVIARVVVANFVPIVLAPRPIAVGGAVTGAALALLALRVEVRTLPRPLALGAGLIAAGLGSILPIYVAIAWGVDPRATGWLALGAVAIASTALVPTARGRAGAALLPVLAAWLLFYGSFGLVTVFKRGPSAAECEAVIRSTRARLVLPRFADGVDRYLAEPYDVLASNGVIVTSFKRIDARGGFLIAVDERRPVEGTRLDTLRPDGSGVFWPERLVRAPYGGRFWVQMIGVGAHGLWELIARRNPGAPILDHTRSIPLTWEPGNPDIDVSRGRLVTSYVPNRQATNPIAQAFALDSLAPVAAAPKPAPRLEMADFVAVDPDTSDVWVPSFFDFGRFAFQHLRGEDLQPIARVETFHPTIGIAPQEARGRLFATNVIAGTLETWDTKTLSLLHTTPAGAFPRDLAFDRVRERLYVAGYSDGHVRVWSTRKDRPVLLHEVAVGSLLRGIGLDPETGRVHAASGCGVFEVVGPDGDPPRPVSATR